MSSLPGECQDVAVHIADDSFTVDGVQIANVYLVATGDDLLLVDTGMPGNVRRILTARHATLLLAGHGLPRRCSRTPPQAVSRTPG